MNDPSFFLDIRRNKEKRINATVSNEKNIRAINSKTCVQKIFILKRRSVYIHYVDE